MSRSTGCTTLMYGASFSWLCALWVVGRWRSSGSFACDFVAEELRELCHPHWRCPLPSTGKTKHIGTERRLMSSQMRPKAKVCTPSCSIHLTTPLQGSLSVTWYVLRIADSSLLACLHLLPGGRPCHVVQRTEKKMTKIIQNVWIAQNLKPDLAVCTQWTHTGEWRYSSTYSFWH